VSDSWPQIMSRFSGVEALRGAELIRQLPGGPVSSSFLLQAGGHRLVARVDRPAARALKLDRLAEIEILQVVSTAGIGPELIWADAQQGLLVCTYLEGTACSREDIRNPVLLQELASTLRTLHCLPPAGPDFEPESAVQNYAEKVATPTAKRMADRAGRLLKQMWEESSSGVLCHNDLVHTNIIHHPPGHQQSGNHLPVRLIDWEYAAVGDPFFDLAAVVRHHELNAPLTKGFLQAYFGSLLPEHLEKLDLYSKLYDYLSGLWYLSMDDGSGQTPGFDEELQRVMARLGQIE
jgi:thiamine kinase